MRSDDAGTLLECSGGSTHDKSQSEHGPWEEFDGDLKDDEMCFLATVVLCESVDECEKERLK